MPQAEAALEAAPVRPASICGWGGGDRVPVTVLGASTERTMRAALESHGRGGVVARGMGRSYGDAAQLRGGLVFDTTPLRLFELDAERGIVHAQAGVTLGRLLAALEPAGWVLPVVPGTQHVTVGGAIAADIHGKNHGVAGTFGMHVRSLGLMTAAGEVLDLSPGEDSDLLDATIGGMGMTGVILWARIALRRIGSAMLSVDTDRVDTLDDALSLLDGPGGPHRVAWIDLLGRRPVRGVVTRADDAGADAAGGHSGAAHATGAGPGAPGPGSATVAARIRIPPKWPAGVLRPGVVRAYNAYRFRSTPRRQRGHLEPFGSHMFPLDVLDAWPRLYGPAGFAQYQLVVGRGRERTLEQVIGRLRSSRVPCYLAVLKDFGAENRAPLSFPMEGWTLALDLPRAAAGLEPLLSSFDELVAEAGGRVYLAKDGRLRADAMAAMYPRLERWREIRDRVDPERIWRSDLALRTGLVEASR